MGLNIRDPGFHCWYSRSIGVPNDLTHTRMARFIAWIMFEKWSTEEKIFEEKSTRTIRPQHVAKLAARREPGDNYSRNIEFYLNTQHHPQPVPNLESLNAFMAHGLRWLLPIGSGSARGWTTRAGSSKHLNFHVRKAVPKLRVRCGDLGACCISNKLSSGMDFQPLLQDAVEGTIGPCKWEPRNFSRPGRMHWITGLSMRKARLHLFAPGNAHNPTALPWCWEPGKAP